MTRSVAASVSVLVLLGGFVAAWATPDEPPSYTLTDLGLGCGLAINDDGFIAGCATGTDGTQHAVVWDSSTGQKTDLGIADSYAAGIDENGVVVGAARSDGVWRAFRLADGVRTELGTLPGDTDSGASAINASGRITGWSSGGSSGTRAFVWSDGVLTDLGGLGGSFTEGCAINDAGEVVGVSSPSGDPMAHDLFVSHAIRWDAASGIGDLDDGTGDLGSSARGINSSGDIVGVTWWWSAGYYESSALLWREGTTTLLDVSGMHGLGASAVNDATDEHGVQIVGTALDAHGWPHATMWELDGSGVATATNLDELVDVSCLLEGLGCPSAISGNSRIVVNHRIDGHVRVLTPASLSSSPTPCRTPTPVPSPAVPGAPASVQAQGGSQSVTVSWSPVTEATSYAVKRAPEIGGPYVTIASGLVGVSSYTDAKAPLGFAYNYVVTAANAAGEGAPSPPAAARPLPYPPIAIRATLRRGHRKHRIVLRWSDSASAGVVRYNVYRRTSDGDALVATFGRTSRGELTGLARHTTYTFFLTAVHESGAESLESTLAETTTR